MPHRLPGTIRAAPSAAKFVDAYTTGLRQRLPTTHLRRLDHIPGATPAAIQCLRARFPAAPTELLCLLQRNDGTLGASLTWDQQSTKKKPKKAEASSFTDRATLLMQRILEPPPSKEEPSSNPLCLSSVAIVGSSPFSYALTSVDQMIGPCAAWLPRLTFRDPRLGEKSASGNGESEEASTLAERYFSILSESSPFRVQGTLEYVSPDQWAKEEALGTLLTPKKVVSRVDAGARIAASSSSSSGVSSAAVESAGDGGVRILVDQRIDPTQKFSNWLVFAEALPMLSTAPTGSLSATTMRRTAGTTSVRAAAVHQRVWQHSRLFLDFAPSSSGDVGQVVRMSWKKGEVQPAVAAEPSCERLRNGKGTPPRLALLEWRVIAPDLGSFLKRMMSEEYEFIEEEIDENACGASPIVKPGCSEREVEDAAITDEVLELHRPHVANDGRRKKTQI